MTKCEICNKPLKLIGADRKNGKVINNKTGKDWTTRTKHKKCWKKELEWNNLLNSLKNIS